ncbi:MAG: hypothetical protein WAU68_16465 [Vitreimonas sp.]
MKQSQTLNALWFIGAVMVLGIGVAIISSLGSWQKISGDGGLPALRRTDNGIELTLGCFGAAELRDTGNVPFASGAVVWALGSNHTGPNFPGYFTCDVAGYSCRLHNADVQNFILTQDRVTNTYAFANGSTRSVTYDLQRLRPLYQELQEQCRQRASR